MRFFCDLRMLRLLCSICFTAAKIFNIKRTWVHKLQQKRSIYLLINISKQFDNELVTTIIRFI